MTETVSVNLTVEWKLAQIKMLESSAMQALNGLTAQDEDYHDAWEAGIPTQIKLQLELVDRTGKKISFIEEWDKLNVKMSENDMKPGVARLRILRKRQLITDLLHELRVWMRLYTDQEPEEDGAFYQPFGGKTGDARSKSEP